MEACVAFCLVVLVGCGGCMAQSDDVTPTVLVNASNDSDSVEPIPSETDESNRGKRDISCGAATALSPSQQAEAVNSHNTFRAKEPAADMFLMNWDENLAARAQELTNKCLGKKHDLTTDCSGKRVGQNIAISMSSDKFPVLDVTNAIRGWNDERNNWDFTSGKCQTGKVCGHWTQVIWSKSTLVGCGYTQCTDVQIDSDVFKYAVIFACDYSLPGNMGGESMYTTGTECSECWRQTRFQSPNVGYKCENNLCVSCSPSTDSACECGPADTCSGKGTWSTTDCACHCQDGFFGPSCEHSCVDKQPTGCSQWASQGKCSLDSYHAFMLENCPATCKYCQ